MTGYAERRKLISGGGFGHELDATDPYTGGVLEGRPWLNNAHGDRMPFASGRSCRRCPVALSRWNIGPECWRCYVTRRRREREARAFGMFAELLGITIDDESEAA